MAASTKFRLDGKCILVVGATGGIGQACVSGIEDLGAKVVATGRRTNAEEELRRLLKHPDSSTTILDLEDGASTQAACATWPEFDGVAFAAGVSALRPLRAQSEADFRRIMRINFESQALLTRELLRQRKLRDGASLVYVGSIAAQVGTTGHTAYSASKAALCGFVRSLAVECAGRRIRANVVSPGLVRTAMAAEMNEALTADQAAAYSAAYPLGVGEAADVAGAVAFLMMSAARWITGTEIVIDGGISHT